MIFVAIVLIGNILFILLFGRKASFIDLFYFFNIISFFYDDGAMQFYLQNLITRINRTTASRKKLELLIKKLT